MSIVLNNQQDTIAIVVSTWNGALYIADLLDSLIAQTYKNWCCYVRDDGSKDSSIEIVRKYAYLDSRIIFLEDKMGNLNIVPSYFYLLGLVKENYIATCDQDDVWHMSKLEVSLLKLKEIETIKKIPALVHTDSVFVDSKLNTLRPAFIGKRGLIPGINGILFANSVQGGSILVNRSLNQIVINHPPTLPYDFQFGVIAELVGVRAFIPEKLLKYRQHSTSAIARSDNENTELRQKSKIPPTLLLSLQAYKHIKNDFNGLPLKKDVLKDLEEYFYLFEGNNVFKKLLILIKNQYPFYRRKDFIACLFLIIQNKKLNLLENIK